MEREIREETGLSISQFEVVEVFTRFDPETAIYTLFIGHRCQAMEAVVQLSAEHTAYRWVTQTEFLALEAPPLLKKMVDKLDKLKSSFEEKRSVRGNKYDSQTYFDCP